MPIAEPLSNENDPSVLGKPFFVIAKVDGASSSAGLLSPSYDAGRSFIFAKMIQIFGHASANHRTLDLERALPEPALESVWGVQLDYFGSSSRQQNYGSQAGHRGRDPSPALSSTTTPGEAFRSPWRLSDG